MKKNTGYRQVLRDRCPKVVSLALKWCKAKEKWLNHVYDNFIWIYSSKHERYAATKIIVGDTRRFDFHSTIDWPGLSQEDIIFWKYVESWVDWFRTKHAYIENTYVLSKQSGKQIGQCKYDIMKYHLLDFCPRSTDSEQTKADKTAFVNKLTDFLIDSFEGRI